MDPNSLRRDAVSGPHPSNGDSPGLDFSDPVIPGPDALGPGTTWPGAAGGQAVPPGARFPAPIAGGRWQRPNRIWPLPPVVLASLVMFLVASILATVLAVLVQKGPAGLATVRDPKNLMEVMGSPTGLALTMVLPQMALALPALLAAALSPIPFLRRLGLVSGHWPLVLWGVAAMATPIIGMISSVLVTSLMGESESLNDMTEVFRKLSASGLLIPLAIGVGLVPGVCEELLFRGYLQSRLASAWGASWGSWGTALSILITSAIFAAFHLDPVHSVGVFALGLYLGWIAWASGSILPAMLAHFVNNFLSVLAVTLLPGADPGEIPVGEAEVPAVQVLAFGLVMLLSVSCLLTTFAVARFHRRPAASRPGSPANDQPGVGLMAAANAPSNGYPNEANASPAGNLGRGAGDAGGCVNEEIDVDSRRGLP